jgi:hypothetical protein
MLGCPCVMISSPEAAKFVLATRAHLFKPTFPASKERMLGKQAIFFHQGDYHAKLRKLVLRAFQPEAIKNIIPSIESIAKDSLQSWEGQGRLINTFQEMKIVSLPHHLEFPRFLHSTPLCVLIEDIHICSFFAVYVQCCPAFHIWKG